MTTVTVKDHDPIHILSAAGNSLLPSGERVAWVQQEAYLYTTTVNGRGYRLLLLGQDVQAGTLDIRLNGKRMLLTYETAEMHMQKTIGIEPGAGLKVSELKAPMPGLIRAIPVKEGDSIAKGDPLLVLEAMKMENMIKSPADVVVASIHVAEGDAVEKNQLLISFS